MGRKASIAQSDLPDGLFGDGRVQPLLQKYSASPLTQIKSKTLPSRSRKRGGSRSSRTLGAGCDGRGSVRRVNNARTNDVAADGEVVWSWRPDAGAKLAETIPQVTVAKEPGHREEHEGNR